MSKHLNEILNKDKKLEGTKSSTIVPGSTGADPGVDYAPKSSGDRAFVAKHKVEKHDDRAGNTKDVYSGDKVKHVMKLRGEQRHGKESPNDQKVYEDTVAVDEAWTKDQHIEYHKGRHERAVAALQANPKDKTMTNTADIEHHARTSLKKLGVTVTKPKHPSVFESFIEFSRVIKED